jgi:cobalt-zinc-cadmium efflux system outer membrane protein
LNIFKFLTGLLFILALVQTFCIFSLVATPLFAEENQAINLQQALDAAIKNNPELAGFSFEIQAAEARSLQASLRPNPELEAEVENISGNLPGAHRSETTVGIRQLFELGGKRPTRIKKAGAELELLRRDYEALHLNLVSDITRAFITLQGMQKRLELTREGYRIASLLASSVAERVAVGAVSPIEETRARVALAFASTDVERALKEVEEVRQELSKAIGFTAPFFSTAVGELRDEVVIPDLNVLERRLTRNPDLTRWEMERNTRDAALAVERSMAIPDVSFFGAFRRINESTENTLVMGLTIPLPAFNRNQGAIREAASALSKTEQERRATEVKLRTQLAQRYSSLASSLKEVRALREVALVGAQRAYDAVSEGYNLGKFRYLDVLDTGKALIESKLRFVDALVALNVAKIDLERLVAGPLEPEINTLSEKQEK